MYWLNKIWGEVIKKRGTRGGNITSIRKILKKGFRRKILKRGLEDWGPRPGWFL